MYGFKPALPPSFPSLLHLDTPDAFILGGKLTAEENRSVLVEVLCTAEYIDQGGLKGALVPNKWPAL